MKVFFSILATLTSIKISYLVWNIKSFQTTTIRLRILFLSPFNVFCIQLFDSFLNISGNGESAPVNRPVLLPGGKNSFRKITQCSVLVAKNCE